MAYVPKSDDTGNTTLPLEHSDYKAIAILDTGAGVSIARRYIWEKWGKRALRKTRMQLQLADISETLGHLGKCHYNKPWYSV